MIIDGEIVKIGFFNFTKAAEEKNAKNLLVIHWLRSIPRIGKITRRIQRHVPASGNEKTDLPSQLDLQADLQGS